VRGFYARISDKLSKKAGQIDRPLRYDQRYVEIDQPKDLDPTKFYPVTAF
jgi:hypothetical protein